MKPAKRKKKMKYRVSWLQINTEFPHPYSNREVTAEKLAEMQAQPHIYKITMVVPA